MRAVLLFFSSIFICVQAFATQSTQSTDLSIRLDCDERSKYHGLTIRKSESSNSYYAALYYGPIGEGSSEQFDDIDVAVDGLAVTVSGKKSDGANYRAIHMSLRFNGAHYAGDLKTTQINGAERDWQIRSCTTMIEAL